MPPTGDSCCSLWPAWELGASWRRLGVRWRPFPLMTVRVATLVQTVPWGYHYHITCYSRLFPQVHVPTWQQNAAHLLLLQPCCTGKVTCGFPAPGTNPRQTCPSLLIAVATLASLPTAGPVAAKSIAVVQAAYDVRLSHSKTLNGNSLLPNSGLATASCAAWILSFSVLPDQAHHVARTPASPDGLHQHAH